MGAVVEVFVKSFHNRGSCTKPMGWHKIERLAAFETLADGSVRVRFRCRCFALAEKPRGAQATLDVGLPAARGEAS